MKVLLAVPALIIVVAWFTGNGVALFEFCTHQIGRQIDQHIGQQHEHTRPVQMGTGR